MENIFVVAYLLKPRKIVVIPAKFIYKLCLSKTLNYCINRNQPHLIFWSNNFDRHPNFHRPLSKKFLLDHNVCYHAKLLKAFGKLF